MRILAFDIASNTGWAYGNDKDGIIDHGNFSCKSFEYAYSKFEDLIEGFFPDIIITAKPTRFYAVIRKQSEITGLLLECAERYGIKVDKDLVDSSCKKVVFADGHYSKDKIPEWYSVENGDEADAMMFIDYYIKVKGWERKTVKKKKAVKKK